MSWIHDEMRQLRNREQLLTLLKDLLDYLQHKPNLNDREQQLYEQVYVLTRNPV